MHESELGTPLYRRSEAVAVHDEFPDEQATYVVFTSQLEDRRGKRREHQEVSVVAANPAGHMHWSEKPIS